MTDREYVLKIVKHGFLKFEAEAFVFAKGPDGNRQDFAAVYDSSPFQSMLRSRTIWIHSLRQQGWSGQKIAGAIRHYYKLKAGRTPFDFLKIEYKPPKQLSDYAFAIKVRAKARISRMASKFGTRYTKPMKQEMRPAEPFQVKQLTLPEKT